MSNVKIKAENLPVLFDEKRRPSSIVEDKNSLAVEGQSFVSYSPKAGYTYRFPSFEEAIIKKQPVTTEENAPVQYLISCMSSEDGKTFVEDWFSLNHLNKRKIVDVRGNGKYENVHPTWAALGNVLRRAQKLCEMGEVVASKDTHSVMVPSFGDNHKIVRILARNTDGTQEKDQDGNPITVIKTDTQDVCDLTPAV